MTKARKKENMTAARRIAVFGGSFDPIHCGHEVLVREVLRRDAADQVLLVPSFSQPFKPQGANASFDDRFAMLHAAFKGTPNVKISRIEAELRRAPAYTSDTMDALRQCYPNDRLLLMIGEDSLYDLHRWHEGRRLAEEYDWLIFPRKMPESKPDLRTFWPETLAAKLQKSILPVPFFEISSMELRKKLEKNEKTANLLPCGVYTYIRRNGLYRSCGLETGEES